MGTVCVLRVLVAWALIKFCKAPTNMYIQNNANLQRSDKNVAYQWLDNVTMYTYAEFDQNIPSGSKDITFATVLNTSCWTM